MKAMLRTVDHFGSKYEALMFWCPGCQTLDEDGDPVGGLNILPVSGDTHGRPMWDWDGNLESPTLSPSILTTMVRGRCHSYLRAGRFEFLGDCTHVLAGQTADMSELPNWVTHEVRKDPA